MPAIENTITTADVVNALDIEFSEKFNQEMSRLTEVLGIFGTETVAAGTAMYQYKVTGSLNTAEVAEGDEVPLSKYAVEKVPIGEHNVRPYRKLTTAQAILKSGFVNAVGKTDDKMIKDIRAGVLDKFFAFLGNGTGKVADGKDVKTLQAVLAQADAALGDALEANGDSAERVVHFVNRFDIADYLAKADVTMQTMFGMSYLQTFLGVNDIFVTSKVPAGTVYVTPTDNIRIYGVDFGSLSQAGIGYTVQDGSLVGVHHQAAYNRTSSETYALVGADLLPEVTDYIVKATIAPVA